MGIDISKLEELKKALEAGGRNAAPGALNQGSALQSPDLSPVMNIACFSDEAIKLQKVFKVTPAKGTLVQFNRQLSYGSLGNSAVLEGGVGADNTSDYVQEVVPMAYYVHTRRATMQAQLIESFDGVKADDRMAADAALKLAADIEQAIFQGKSAYSNNGVFDGNPAWVSQSEPGMHGLDIQIRSSDGNLNTQDLMLNEYGADSSVVINQNGVLSQTTIEDVYSRAQMNNGNPKKIYIDPLTHGAYNKVSHTKERIILAGSPQNATGASLNEQFVAGGALSIESSRFLSGKTNPKRPTYNTPDTPSIAAAQAANSTSFLAGEVYQYAATAAGDLGESPWSTTSSVTIAANGNQVAITITPAAGIAARYFNMYRSRAGETKKEFIGRVVNNGAATTVFTDLNNRIPGFVTGFALDMDGMELKELSSFKSKSLAETDLSSVTAYYRFVALQVALPRKNLLIDNLSK